jgi:hypothetical protein
MDLYLGQHRKADFDNADSDLDLSTKASRRKWDSREEPPDIKTKDVEHEISGNKLSIPESVVKEEEEKEADLESADIKAEPASEPDDHEFDIHAFPVVPYNPGPGYYTNLYGPSVNVPWPQDPYSGISHNSYSAVLSTPTPTLNPIPPRCSLLGGWEKNYPQLLDALRLSRNGTSAGTSTSMHSEAGPPNPRCKFEAIRLRLTRLDKQVSIVARKLHEERVGLAFAANEWRGNGLEGPSLTELVVQMLEQQRERLALAVWDLESDRQSLMFRFPGLGDGSYKASTSRRRCRGCCAWQGEKLAGEEDEEIWEEEDGSSGHRSKRVRR